MDRYGEAVADYQLSDPLPCPPEHVAALAGVKTRLARLDEPIQEGQINWGYAVCDAALRRWMDPSLPKGSFPYPRRAV